MKKSELRMMVREIVREEVALTVKEVIKEIVGGKPHSQPKSKPKKKQLTSVIGFYPPPAERCILDLLKGRFVKRKLPVTRRF